MCMTGEGTSGPGDQNSTRTCELLCLSTVLSEACNIYMHKGTDENAINPKCSTTQCLKLKWKFKVISV